jgi:hypothetical protein
LDLGKVKESDMGVITRSEAVHRLKLLSSKLSNAVTECRDGRWKNCHLAAFEAQELLDALMPHLEEASIIEVETVGAMSSTPYTIPPETKSTGGMGYRGGAGNKVSSSAPPPPIVNRGSAPPPPIARPKATVTPRPAAAPPKPIIVTPPPVTRKLEETKTFDLSRISGQEAWWKRSQSDTTIDPTDWEMTDAFDRLTSDEKAKIVKKYNETKQPVTLMEVL